MLLTLGVPFRVRSGDLQQATASLRKPSEQRALNKLVTDSYGNPDTWDHAALQEMGSLITKMDAKSLKSIPKAQVSTPTSFIH